MLHPIYNWDEAYFFACKNCELLINFALAVSLYSFGVKFLILHQFFCIIKKY